MKNREKHMLNPQGHGSGTARKKTGATVVFLLFLLLFIPVIAGCKREPATITNSSKGHTIAPKRVQRRHLSHVRKNQPCPVQTLTGEAEQSNLPVVGPRTGDTQVPGGVPTARIR